VDEMQVLFNVIIGVAGLFGGWILNNISRAIERLDKDVREMPKVYVTKADYKDDIQYIKTQLDRIFDLIGELNQNKADK
jgi:hypothetical protein